MLEALSSPIDTLPWKHFSSFLSLLGHSDSRFGEPAAFSSDGLLAAANQALAVMTVRTPVPPTSMIHITIPVAIQEATPAEVPTDSITAPSKPHHD
jgi:hypothetical protein